MPLLGGLTLFQTGLCLATLGTRTVFTLLFKANVSALTEVTKFGILVKIWKIGREEKFTYQLTVFPKIGVSQIEFMLSNPSTSLQQIYPLRSCTLLPTTTNFRVQTIIKEIGYPVPEGQ